MLLNALSVKNLIWVFIKNIIRINHCYILQRNMRNLVSSGNNRRKWKVRVATDDDIKEIRESIRNLDDASKKEVVVRLLFYHSGFKNCYIARTSDGDIAYIQWLIYPYENNIIRKHYRYRFHELREKQVMVENVFTYPKYRGYGLMRDMTNELLNIAKEKGYNSAIIYVRKDLTDVINDRIVNGFKITKIVTELKIFGYCKRFL